MLSCDQNSQLSPKPSLLGQEREDYRGHHNNTAPTKKGAFSIEKKAQHEACAQPTHVSPQGYAIGQEGIGHVRHNQGDGCAEIESALAISTYQHDHEREERTGGADGGGIEVEFQDHGGRA